MKKLNITFCSFPDYSGNAKALFEYMRKRYNDKMNYTWIVNNENSINMLNKLDIKSILIGTEEFENYIAKTDIFFTTHANLTGDKEKAKESIYIELWHGIGPKPVGFLTKNMLENDKKWYNSLSSDIDYIITSSDMWKTIYSSMFNINPERILPLGLPLLDEIKSSDGINNLSLILNKDITKYNKIIYYMPTFKLGCGRSMEGNLNQKNIFNLKKYDEQKLLKYLKDNNYLLCIKRHPSDECIYNKIENDNIINITNEMLQNHSLNVNNILNATDLLITDYSSLGTEISFIDKPVIFLSTDVEDYEQNRGIIFNDYSFWTDNIECGNYEELIILINKYIGKKYFNKHKKLNFSDLKDGGCDRICYYLFEGNQISKNIYPHKSEKTELRKKIDEYKKQLEEKQIEINKLNSDLNYQLNKIDKIVNSKGWKIIEKVRKVTGKGKNNEKNSK